MAQKTIAFFGASTGVGLSALKYSLAAGHRCIALCREPTKLTNAVANRNTTNLQVLQGNAHDAVAASRCLKASDSQLVDEIVFTIGARQIPGKMALDDPHVCEKGISTVIGAITGLRKQGLAGRPHIIVCSTTGLSKFGRDTPVVIVPVYALLLKVPGADKKIMEDKLANSGEDFTIVRASRLIDGETDKKIRVGIEDPETGIESKAIGYSISREDAGRWIAQNLVQDMSSKYMNKTVTITN
ncbi:NAD(P)-binding protein [Hypomontagnella submonticulosa]|nr:NAD(P)-binding protein [Hypomontagnella submonticulosa]